MKNLKNGIVISGISSLFIVMTLLYLNENYNSTCYLTNDNGNTVKACQNYIFLIFPFVLSLIFPILTYKMKDEVFISWFNFAKWWVPIIILVTYLQNTQTGGGGLGIGGALSSGFDMVVLGFFYFIFVVVSLIIIIKKYRALR